MARPTNAALKISTYQYFHGMVSVPRAHNGASNATGSTYRKTRLPEASSPRPKASPSSGHTRRSRARHIHNTALSAAKVKNTVSISALRKVADATQ